MAGVNVGNNNTSIVANNYSYAVSDSGLLLTTGVTTVTSSNYNISSFLITPANTLIYGIGKADASLSTRLKFVGYLTASVTAGATATFSVGSVSGFTNLNPGVTYYLQNGGGIGTLAGSNSVVAGLSIGTDTIKF